MKIVYIHHAMREKGNPPSQNDNISALGLEDAKITAKVLKTMADNSKINFKAIYTSPYFRCKKTAEIINECFGLPIHEDARLNEFNSTPKNGTKNEAWVQCQLAIRSAIKDIVNSHEENDAVICVTSGVNISGFIGLAYKIPANENMPFSKIPSCSPICFDIDKDCFKNMNQGCQL